MTHLSVNLNKVALVRNSRGHNQPNLLQVALDCEKFGAQGITVHPRPDERHVTYADLAILKQHIATELNIEGNPTQRFIDEVLAVKPAQVTLVPDAPDALTSNAGWDTLAHKDFLTEVIAEFKRHGIRTSIFVDPVEAMVEGAKATGTDRVELYTEAYARDYHQDRARALAPYLAAAKRAEALGIGLNAGHDLNLDNLRYFQQNIPQLLEVSIGHALICDALYLGLETTIKRYLTESHAKDAA
ncbi:pyridoxine 5'-phosphate synthase [Leeia oryzae]|uniref:pyridoxine 5'-phosphate synthase n=1 Tax=Leeia oryzae TaxID=356662 RepID=UPI0004760F4A|nr:pyridoxine 5'-phosphate synthase [Leeia oryzae]